MRYASSGYPAIDNNVSEQHMKTIATGRKTRLFTGSEDGGKTMAILFSVVSSCRRHGHDPFVYLRDVLGRLPGLSKDRLAGLLSDRWSAPPAADAAVPVESAPLLGRMVAGRHVGGVALVTCDEERVPGPASFQGRQATHRSGHLATGGSQPAILKVAGGAESPRGTGFSGCTP
jgi:hypothetical protein